MLKGKLCASWEREASTIYLGSEIVSHTWYTPWQDCAVFQPEYDECTGGRASRSRHAQCCVAIVELVQIWSKDFGRYSYAMRSTIVKFFVHSQLGIVIFEKRAVHRFAENSDASPRPLTSAEEAQIQQKTFLPKRSFLDRSKIMYIFSWNDLPVFAEFWPDWSVIPVSRNVVTWIKKIKKVAGIRCNF